uniref:Uncharacterized protein n=1 Tax=Plectus sambesii TaxID=2011161 RepID=A0A914XR63_9BILA
MRTRFTKKITEKAATFAPEERRQVQPTINDSCQCSSAYLPSDDNRAHAFDCMLEWCDVLGEREASCSPSSIIERAGRRKRRAGVLWERAKRRTAAECLHAWCSMTFAADDPVADDVIAAEGKTRRITG